MLEEYIVGAPPFMEKSKYDEKVKYNNMLHLKLSELVLLAGPGQ